MIIILVKQKWKNFRRPYIIITKHKKYDAEPEAHSGLSSEGGGQIPNFASYSSLSRNFSQYLEHQGGGRP